MTQKATPEVQRKQLFKPKTWFMKPEPVAPPKTAEQLKKEEADQAKIRKVLELRYAQVKLKELYQLFTDIEKSIGNRAQRKQFRRDFISDGKVMGGVIEFIIARDQKYIDEIEEYFRKNPDQAPKLPELPPIPANTEETKKA